MATIIRPFSPEELEALSRFAQDLNARRESMSSFCCAKAEDIRRDLEKELPYGFACWDGDRPVGLMSCCPDREKGNADCSLLLDLTGEDYREAAGRLVRAAREALGPGLACTFFFPKENEDCRAFLEGAGARRQENEYILRLKPENWNRPAVLPAGPLPAQEEDRDAFIALHDRVFPGVYISGRDIWEDLGRSRFIYKILDREGFAAYGVLRVGRGTRAAAEVIAVREDVRHQGYGRSVLHHLAEESFRRLGMEELELVVDADNENALKPYFDTGFRLWQENNCYILG